MIRRWLERRRETRRVMRFLLSNPLPWEPFAWTMRQQELFDAGLCGRLLYGGYCGLGADHGGGHRAERWQEAWR